MHHPTRERTDIRVRTARPVVWLLLLGAAACYGSSTGEDAATDDGSTDDATGPGGMRIEIQNMSGTQNAFVDACPHCNEAWQLRRVDGTPEDLTLPGLLTCRCTACTSSACAGMSDGPFSWIEIPPGATLAFEWDGRRHDFSAGGCTSTGSGCWTPSAAAAGTYEIRVAYSLEAGTSATRACPGGGVPWEIQPYQETASIARCERTCAGRGCPALTLDAVATTSFAWPGTASVRVELGGG